MQGRVFSSGSYRFGFNNQEKDSELGDAYAFEYRIHDARLGRFLSVDPLSPKFPWNSNYAFAENQVVNCIDAEGSETLQRTTVTFTNPAGVTTSLFVISNINSGGPLTINYQIINNGVVSPIVPPPITPEDFQTADPITWSLYKGMQSGSKYQAFAGGGFIRPMHSSAGASGGWKEILWRSLSDGVSRVNQDNTVFGSYIQSTIDIGDKAFDERVTGETNLLTNHLNNALASLPVVGAAPPARVSAGLPANAQFINGNVSIPAGNIPDPSNPTQNITFNSNTNTQVNQTVTAVQITITIQAYANTQNEVNATAANLRATFAGRPVTINVVNNPGSAPLGYRGNAGIAYKIDGATTINSQGTVTTTTTATTANGGAISQD